MESRSTHAFALNQASLQDQLQVLSYVYGASKIDFAIVPSEESAVDLTIQNQKFPETIMQVVY